MPNLLVHFHCLALSASSTFHVGNLNKRVNGGQKKLLKKFMLCPIEIADKTLFYSWCYRKFYGLWSLLNTHYRYNMSNLGQSEIVLIQGPICPKCNANEFYETPRSRPFWYTILRKGMQVLSISFVFCSQKYLVQMGGRSLANTNSKALNLNPTISVGKGSGLVLLIRQGVKEHKFQSTLARPTSEARNP